MSSKWKCAATVWVRIVRSQSLDIHKFYKQLLRKIQMFHHHFALLWISHWCSSSPPIPILMVWANAWISKVGICPHLLVIWGNSMQFLLLNQSLSYKVFWTLQLLLSLWKKFISRTFLFTLFSLISSLIMPHSFESVLCLYCVNELLRN